MITTIAKTLNLSTTSVKGCISLLNEGASIPFIARYRKEATGGIDELQISSIRDEHIRFLELEKRKEVILESLNNQGLLTDKVRSSIQNAPSISELEDIYLPFRPKRKTKASIAKERGLEPLAKMIIVQDIPDFQFKAERFTKHPDIANADDAISGALDIIAEWISERAYIRKGLRHIWQARSVITAKKKTKAEDVNNKYSAYYKWEEQSYKAPSHRILALFRGEKEGVLSLKIAPEEERGINFVEKAVLKKDSVCENEIHYAAKDAYKRLLSSSLETEYRKVLKEKADAKAINIFAENLKQLLMLRPMGQKVTLALDPGFKSGCKLVVLDAQGKLLHNETIYPHPPQNQTAMAKKKLGSLVNMYKVEAISIGNGTAGRETEEIVKSTHFDRDLVAVMVNENGASVYSASAVAREEFPDYDITVRGAVSIGRRLQDPLAELVKIDPKAIGVGQYQHDVDQKKLQNKLTEVVSSVVNKVGVELNTASKELLQYVAGVGPQQAKKIIEYRNKNGAFSSRQELLKVSGFGKKAFEQAAGFIRINGAKNPLDNTAVHPESYFVVEAMAKARKLKVEELINNTKVLASINPENFVSDKIGLFTVKDIISELQKPNRDPRKKVEVFEFDKSIKKPSDLKEGMILPGVITNITAFGAFVDVGVHQDGLVHISKLTQGFVSDPHDVVKLNQKVEVKVIQVDLEKKRIQFSMVF